MPAQTTVVVKNGFVGYNTGTATGLSAAAFTGVKEIRFRREKAQNDDAVMGDTIAATVPGIETADVSVISRQSYGTGSLDEKLNGLYINETVIPILEIRQSATAVSTTNPRWRMANYYVASIVPLSVAHGQVPQNEYLFKPATGATITRATST